MHITLWLRAGDVNTSRHTADQNVKLNIVQRPRVGENGTGQGRQWQRLRFPVSTMVSFPADVTTLSFWEISRSFLPFSSSFWRAKGPPENGKWAHPNQWVMCFTAFAGHTTPWAGSAGAWGTQAVPLGEPGMDSRPYGSPASHTPGRVISQAGFTSFHQTSTQTPSSPQPPFQCHLLELWPQHFKPKA
jgi:hypothetical protein